MLGQSFRCSCFGMPIQTSASKASVYCLLFVVYCVLSTVCCPLSTVVYFTSQCWYFFIVLCNLSSVLFSGSVIFLVYFFFFSYYARLFLSIIYCLPFTFYLNTYSLLPIVYCLQFQICLMLSFYCCFFLLIRISMVFLIVNYLLLIVYR